MFTTAMLTWSRYWLLAGFGFNLLYECPEGSKGRRKYVIIISGNLPQLRYPVPSSNAKNEDLAACIAQTAGRSTYTVLGDAVGKHNRHPLSIRCKSSWVKVPSGK